MEYYSAIRKGNPAICDNPEDIMLSKLIQKDKCFSYLYVGSENMGLRNRE